jgi:hypothetical protein
MLWMKYAGKHRVLSSFAVLFESLMSDRQTDRQTEDRLLKNWHLEGAYSIRK